MKDNFNKIYWLCVYVVTWGFLLLAALIWVPVPQENHSMANLAMGFITATIIGVPLAYIFGGNPSNAKKQGATAQPGKVDLSLSANTQATTEPEPTKEE